MKCLIILFWVLAFVSPVKLQTERWRGVVPLRSTREDVEKAIGPPMTPNGITYDLSDERVNVVYSDGSCGKGAQWRVPRGTVIGVTVYPKRQQPISEFPIQLTKFRRFTNLDRVYYSNPNDGITYGTTEKGNVVVIEYYPATKDEYLRCRTRKRPLTNDELRYYIFDEYSDLPISDENARLDNFAGELHRESKAKGYILVYAPKSTPSRKLLTRANRARNYLIKKWHVDDKRIEVRKGGYRQELTIELYLVASGN